MSYKASKMMVGGFSENDGTIDFYLRVNSLIKNTSIVIDLGAGRAAWYEDDNCKTRRDIRLLKGKVKQLIAADVDEVVFTNKSSDKQILIKDGKLDIESNSADVIIADYVLEHIENPSDFFNQINNCLKSGGWFCARTPHKYCYVALISSLLKDSLHAKLLSFIQPNRKEIDVFPTRYKLNQMKDIKSTFADWENLSFIYRAEPDYYFGNKIVFKFQSLIHRIMPSFLCGNLFIFVKKP
jgi:SAM-dependent methyltransferase